MEESRTFLILSQNDIFEALTATWESCQTARKLSVVQAKIIRVDELKSEFDQLRKNILQYNSKCLDKKDMIETKTNTFNNMFEAIYGRFLELKENQESEQSSRPHNNNSMPINLQPLKLIHFNGELEKWQQFKSLYDSLIHENTSLPKIQKLHYLRSHIFGDAAALIQNIQIQEENYDLCYDLLVERYSSPRRLINFYTGQLLQFDHKDAKNYDRFLMVHLNAIKALKNLELDDLADCLLFQLSYRNLSPSDRHTFDASLLNDEIPTTDQLFNFLKRRLKTNELQEDLNYKSNPRFHNRSFNKKEVSLVSTKGTTSAKTVTCSFCKENHRIYTCTAFLGSSIPDRIKWIKQNRKCQKCLGNHSDTTCQSESSCKDCNSKFHHTYLHETETVKNAPHCLLTPLPQKNVLLGTLNIRVRTGNNEWITAKGILDSASQVNLMTVECARKLKLPFDSTSGSISGVSAHLTRTFGSVTCEVDVGQHTTVSEFRILNTICSPQPNFTVSAITLKRIQTLKLADENFYKKSAIEVLLGAELVSQLISDEDPVLVPGEPAALRTHYGYVLFGKMNSDPMPLNRTALSITTETLTNELRRFWELEEVQKCKFESPENIFCEDLFTKTYTRDERGRYQVRLPIKPNAKPLLSNRDRAYNSYIKMENERSKQPEIKKAYDEFLQKYVELDYMELAETSSKYIHTHHAVFKESSSTSLRVVFNGSTPDSNGNSLNSSLYTGPKLQASLPNILDNFRAHKFVIIADISKMFNQILIHQADRKLQHLFWRPPGQTKVQEYELKRLSFGHVSSPWLALRVLKQLVIDEGHNYPRATDCLSHWTYVDDIITGVDSVEEGKLLSKELVDLLDKGGFQLKKWISNCPELLSEFSINDLETPRIFKDEKSYFKVLGITWLPDEDVFSFNCSAFSGTITKRSILTFVARLFDPCGWCSPVILKAKLFIQKCWLSGIAWDDALPEPLISQWSEFVKEFHLLSNLKIPRNLAKDNSTYRLLGFCDGSSEAYGCCVYLQIINGTSSKCHLIRAKSKVSPLKTLSIPRIELLAAHTLVKLVETIKHERFPFSLEDTFYFTDSEIVLYWISSPPHSLKTFVANRISDIQNKTLPTQWRHVSSGDNPSDPISRGLLPSHLLQSSIYWNGPTFLQTPITDWPKNPALKSKDVPELKPTKDCLNVIAENSFADVLTKYSSLTKVQNVFAYVRRYSHNLRYPKNRLFGPLSAKEKQQALLTCARITQTQYFPEEYQLLRLKKQLPRPFAKLSPFIDEETSLIRAGGRLRNSQLPYHSKHPVLLPKSAHLSKLICEFYHVTSLHSGVNTVQSMIIKNWWIFSLRSLLRKCIFSCLKCYKLKSKPTQPFMADLPTSRVCISRPFAHVGTDFCGPFVTKESRRRNAKLLKAYLCVFICFTTKAVHLEVVTELSTAAFLASFDRFVSRRSLPSCVYSDNGTNYQGACNQLKEVQKWLQEQKEEIYSLLACRQVEWKFTPPNAPNFGGLWESAVKTAKTLLMRTIGQNKLTFEELATVFAKIEAIMNSRPLTPLTPTPDDDLDFLTPGHFLVGSTLVGIPKNDVLDEVAPSTRWTEVSKINQRFWKRWSREYLHTISQRSKWGRRQDNVKEGQLVFMTKMNTSPLSWPLGRIMETHPGKDGIVRVVTIKTAAGTYLRPTNSLLPLPLQM